MKAIININDLSVPPSLPTKNQTIEDALKELEQIKQKNIKHYDRCFRETKLPQFKEQRSYWEFCKFKVIDIKE